MPPPMMTNATSSELLVPRQKAARAPRNHTSKKRRILFILNTLEKFHISPWLRSKLNVNHFSVLNCC